MGKKLGKSEKSSLAGSDFGEFPQGYGVVKKEKGPKKEPHGPVQGTVRASECPPSSRRVRILAVDFMA